MSSSPCSSGSDDGLVLRRPRGRAARRMLKDLSTSPSPVTRNTSILAPFKPSGYDQNETPSRLANRPMQSEIDSHRSSARSPSATRSEHHTSLFVSPTKSVHSDDDENDEADGLPATSLFQNKSRFAELVAQKRAEREAREAAAAEKRERNQLERESSPITDHLDVEIDDAADINPADAEIERIMSDAAKPSRRASKKAMLEIERETQRLARQQALAHQMKVKKKFTMADLLARFEPHGALQRDVPNAVTAPAATEELSGSSSTLHSDASEPRSGRSRRNTPPSSPPTPLDRQRALVERGALSKLVPAREDSLTSLVDLPSDDDAEMPDMAEILRSSQRRTIEQSPSMKTAAAEKKGLKLARFGKKAMTARQDDSDDDHDDLEIIRVEAASLPPSRFHIFDKIKAQPNRATADSKALHTLRHLSHIGSDANHVSRRKGAKFGASRPSVNPSVLETQLRARAREQARVQQLERIAELKAKGVEVLSAEDREKEEEVLESLLEKARKEALQIRKSEREAAGKKGDGEDDEDEDDGEWKAEASPDEDEDERDVEDDEDEDEGSEGEGDDEVHGEGLVDDAAEESVEGDAEEDEALEDGEPVEATELIASMLGDEEDHESRTPRMAAPRSRKSRIIRDDDDEEEQPIQSSGDNDDSFAPATQKELPLAEDPFAAFGFGAHNQGNALMSPTQAFHATMQTPTQLTQQDSMEIYRRFAPPTMSSLAPVPTGADFQVAADDSQVSVIPGSQPVAAEQHIDLGWETQAPETPVPHLRRGASALSIDTPGWEPTQDDGLSANLWQETAGLRRDDTLDSTGPIETGTQATVRIRISESPAPIAKRGRLVRGQRQVVDSSDEDEGDATHAAENTSKNAFREMARIRKEALTAAERDEAARQAKNMMDEQAEESEDEYAGLGGDDYIAPETEQDHDIIDSSHVEVDERALAAHYAERQRIEDEENANKLYKDLTTGALRRKQANMFDLDEDEDDLALRKRQARQREEARRRRVLLQDDNIAGLAEGKQSKGKDAFLKAIADDGADEDMLDLSDNDEEDVQPESVLPAEGQAPVDKPTVLQEISGNKRRREDSLHERLPANKRRTPASAFRAPVSILEVKQSLSFLLDDPSAPLSTEELIDADAVSEPEDRAEDSASVQDVDEEDDDLSAELARQNDGGFAPDRVMMPPPRLPASQRRTPAPAAVVIDRLSLKRSSSNAETGTSGTSAWAAPSGVHTGVPSLLRRATTNTAFAANERGVTMSNGGSSLSRENSTGSAAGVKIGGSKKSSLAYQARAEERRAIVEAGARQRAENTARIAEMRRSSSGSLGRGLAGKFE